MMPRILFLALFSIAAACSNLTGPAANVEPVKLYTMDCGSITMPPNMLDSSDSFGEDERRYLPVPCYLIRHPKGDLMWDSGLPDALKENPVETDKYKMWVERTLESQLEDIGVPAADVEYLILSHSHLDHAGNAALFENSTWIVDAAEVEFAESDFAKNLGIASPFEDPGTELQLISSDQDLFGDGVVRLVQTPGHTGGHISLLLTLENAGPLIFTGDLYHFPESRKKRLIPDINLDDEQTRASMEKFEKTVEETGARVVIQHSPEDFESMPKFPAYLD